MPSPLDNLVRIGQLDAGLLAALIRVAREVEVAVLAMRAAP
jgi:hypothetical protein